MIKFTTSEKAEYTLIHFELDDPIQPELLRDIQVPKVDPSKGIVLSGRGPIWLYCFLTHHYHTTKFVATYDPRLKSGVITETHHPSYKVGTQIAITLKNLEKKCE